MSTSAVQHPQFLRSLDCFEEHFWILEKVTSRSHILAVKVRGSASQEQWRAAFTQVQRRYPMLNASIGKYPGGRPFFHLVPCREIPLQFLTLTGEISLEAFVEGELLKSFASGAGPLTRVTLFKGEKHSAIVIASHHSALDGRSHLYILRDVLTVLAGEHLPDEPQPLAAPASRFFERTTPPYQRRASLNDGEPPGQTHHAIAPIHIVRHKVPRAELATLLAACRSQGVSFHSALLVAIARAGSYSNDEWKNNGVRSLTPFDVRTLFGLEGMAGVLFTLHRIVLQDSVPFWSEAKRLSDSLKDDPIRDASLAFYRLAEHLVTEEHSPGSHLAAIAGTEFVHDLMVTNYGVLDLGPIGEFQIEDMFTAGIAGHLQTQKIAAVTLNGDLNLTLVAQQPIPSLLETAISEIREASKGLL
jgi:NRPS condensation-like uncharacterized protein